MSRRIATFAGVAAVVAVAVTAAALYFAAGSTPQSASAAGGTAAEQRLIERGGYLARLGDCHACHTARDGEPYAGGLEMPTPFGPLYTTNITPDPETGIGNWTSDDFWQALHGEKAKDGSVLYPAMPFTRDDADAMYAYFRSIKPVRQPNRARQLRFPYNKRELLHGWRTLYFREGVPKEQPKQTSEWNGGAYLVEGLGHCNAGHSSRNLPGAVTAGDGFSGGLIPARNCSAPSLASSRDRLA